MLTALTVALTLTARLAYAWWRMRRALIAVQAERRITEAAIARDHAAGVERLLAAMRQHDTEQAVIASADAVLTNALARHAQHGEPS